MYTHRRNLTWQDGRKLWKIDDYIEYTYNADGVRIKKHCDFDDEDKEETVYTVNGTTILAESRNDGIKLYYFYDENGSPVAFEYYESEGDTSPDMYYYLKNIQGDIIGLVDNSGAVVVKYTYDSWGKLLSVTKRVVDADTGEAQYADVMYDYTHIANINPLRYRGYYYDVESAFYYLNGRYYDPEVRRFINADTTDLLTATPMGLTDKNLFAYCDNNPVIRADHGGEFWHIVIGAAVGGVIGGISSIVAQAVSGQKINWAEVGISAVSGAISGGINAAVPGMGALATGLVQGTVGAATYAATELVNGRTPTVAGTVAAGVTSGVLAGGMRALGNALSKSSPPKNLGTPFKGIGSGQIGVDPNTLTLNQNFTPHPAKYASALLRITVKGMYGVVDVGRDGFVVNGQHRVLIGRMLGLAVDVAIK